MIVQRALIVGAGLLGAMCLVSKAGAAPVGCDPARLAALGVPNMAITTATVAPAAAPSPDYCDVIGSVTTKGDGAADGSAKFEIKLPSNWNGKLLFWGVGGLAGDIYSAGSRADNIEALAKGYATAITDTGHHAGGTDAEWSLASAGAPDTPKLVDYYYRAIHDVTIAAKQLAKSYFKAGAVDRAYFDGCSNGGREAMVEATRYPDDFDGIIAGAPFMDIRVILGGVKFQKVQLSLANYIPSALLPMVDRAVYARCDAADGVKDGLIQNPAKCAFDPASLVCKAGETADCLTKDQATTLNAYFSAMHDGHGKLIYPGQSVTDLAGGMDAWSSGVTMPIDFAANEPWGGKGFDKAPLSWQFVDHIVKFIVERDPAYDIRKFAISKAGVVGNAALTLFDERTGDGNGSDPAKLSPFIQKGHKLLMYHGFSDPALMAFRTVKYYEDLAAMTLGHYDRLQDNVRLFMVPGMQHCAGGPGPNSADTLSALEDWVELGKAPNGLIAKHYVDNKPSQPVDRSMPLCMFPEQAEYKGSGDVRDAANWSCSANRKLLEVGPNGIQAGLTAGDD